MKTIDLHPLCTLFPRMDGAEFNALVADIRAHGLREPITLYRGMILDGGNRYRACVAAGIAPTFADFTGDNIVTFVLSKNLHRRHLTPGQNAAIVASAQDWARANTHGGDRRSEQSARLHFDSAESRASDSGASVRTQKMADKVARAAPELAAQVARGETTLPKAVEAITGKRPGKRATPADDEGPSYQELAAIADDLRRENDVLRAQNAALIAQLGEDDARAQLALQIRLTKHAEREQGNAMDRAAGYQKREKYAVDMCRQCGRAVGVKDPAHTDLRDIVKAVRAYVEAHA